MIDVGLGAEEFSIDERSTTSTVVLSNIAGNPTTAMWIYIAEKVWA
jgi:hypothetical protein